MTVVQYVMVSCRLGGARTFYNSTRWLLQVLGFPKPMFIEHKDNYSILLTIAFKLITVRYWSANGTEGAMAFIGKVESPRIASLSYVVSANKTDLNQM